MAKNERRNERNHYKPCIAQLVEQSPSKRWVVGSILTAPNLIKRLKRHDSQGASFNPIKRASAKSEGRNSKENDLKQVMFSHFYSSKTSQASCLGDDIS